jgi:hypothetical protein
MTMRITNLPFTRGKPSTKSMATSTQMVVGTSSSYNRPVGVEMLYLVALAGDAGAIEVSDSDTRIGNEEVDP